MSAEPLSPLKRAFLALEETRERLARAEAAAREPIAIVGLGCRVPGADGPDAFWSLLRDGVDAVGPPPDGRFGPVPAGAGDAGGPAGAATLQGGFVPGIDRFDPEFFGIARREAQGMDPQQRLLLEVAWEALEHAGVAPRSLERSATGVYVGVCSGDYGALELAAGQASLLNAHYASGVAHSVVSGRLSYLLGLQGPSISIDTACSSSLVAVHLACQALRAGDCRMALAGGVNAMLSTDLFVAFSQSRMLSPDGRCKAFSADADGFGRAEGCGIVVLKRASDALADGDRVLALIRGSAVNQDGPSSGLTAPNGPAQVAVIREALARAGVEPARVDYVEAHGTGTPLGDPLEMQALGEVFAADRPRDRPLRVGSVKSNLGHLEAAAGVTGLIKVVLSMRHDRIPPHLHCARPSPHIPWDELPVEIPVSGAPWGPAGARRIAGVSAFGFSGTNAHVVLESAEPVAPTASEDGGPAAPGAFVLSARTIFALRELARRSADAIARSDAPVELLCRSAACGRSPQAVRATVVMPAMTREALCGALRAIADDRAADGVSIERGVRGDPKRIAFMFTGQGAQYAGMGAALYRAVPEFRRHLDDCDAIASPLLGRSLLDVMMPPEGAPSPIDDTAFTQPALFALEYALARWLDRCGVHPFVAIGHSIGELVAACLAGVFELPQAVAIVVERGRLMQSLPPGGGMLAVHAPVARVEALADIAGVAIAAVNAPDQTVLSGARADLDRIERSLTEGGVRCRALVVSHAFHSALVDPVLDAFEAVVAGVPMHAPVLRVISNLTGRVADAVDLASPSYWRRHVRGTVRFAEGAETLAGLRPDLCVELGPHPVLGPFAQECFDAGGPPLLGTLRRGRDDRHQILELLATLFRSGVDVDWSGYYGPPAGRLADLPTYPFERERFWFAAGAASAARPVRRSGLPLAGTRVPSPLADVVQFEQVLDASLAFLRDHRVGGDPILPAAGHVELALEAGRALFGATPRLCDVVVGRPLRVPDGTACVVQCVIRREGAGLGTFEIVSRPAADEAGAWTAHVRGRYEPGSDAPADRPDVAAVRARCLDRIDPEAHLARMAAVGLAFGPSLHGLGATVRTDGEALAEVALPDAAEDGTSGYMLHPALLDACLQAIVPALPDRVRIDRPYLPIAIDTIEWLAPLAGSLTSHVRVEPSGRDAARPETLRADVTVLADGGVAARLRGVVLRPMDGAAASVRAAAEAAGVEIEWTPIAADTGTWMPGVGPLRSLAEVRVAARAAGSDLRGYARAAHALGPAVTAWMVAAFAELGWSPRAGERFSPDALALRLGVPGRNARMLARMLAVLAEDGVLRPVDGGWEVVASPPAADPAAETEALVRAHPAASVRAGFVARCGSMLADVLAGRADPLQALFPGGSSDAAQALYRESAESEVMNGAVADVLASVASAVPEGRALSVLEVGGGTGGTTVHLLPVLDPDRTRYVFTDIGPALVERARRDFGTHRFVECAVLDLDRDTAAQGFGDRRFDAIVASNVVHATRDLRRTLARLRGLLEPGGLLIVLEPTQTERWVDLSFGLTDGWWCFEDTDVRRDSPLLGTPAWLSLLSEAGFEAVAADACEHGSTQVMLLARRAGSIEAPTGAGSRWVVLGDAQGAGEALVASMRARGLAAEVVAPGEDVAVATARIRGATAGEGAVPAGVVDLRALDLAAADEAGSPGGRVDALRAVLEPSLALVRALDADGGGDAHDTRRAALVMVTRGARAVAGVGELAPEQAPMWGFADVLAAEMPGLATSCVDLDPDDPVEASAEALADMLAAPDRAEQVAFRSGVPHVPRVRRLVLPGPLPETTDLRVVASASGLLEAMSLQSIPRRAPGPGEVEVRVAATALNFRDVLNAMAMRDDDDPLGGECSGVVSAVGAGVEGLAVGDRVVALAPGCMSTRAIARAEHVAHVPDGIGCAEAATLPLAFMTARHALLDIARIGPGRTVLVHAGAGGVGLAAIQVALRAGATVFATAGSGRKRMLLASLGVVLVADSRRPGFGRAVLERTGGRGVDVVLNSLVGPAIGESVSCLAVDGCFVEIGKRELWSAERFAAERPSARYVVLDLSATRLSDPDRWTALFRDVVRAAGAGEIRPLPYTGFPLERMADAFRHMAQARHVGKVMLTDGTALAEPIDRPRSDASYLVTGGLEGLGLATAQRLAQRGAGRIVLAGRSAPGEAAMRAIEAMRELGCTVVVERADVSEPADLRRLVRVAHDPAMPLRGVVHAAGVLSDGAVSRADWTRFVPPLRPKIEGAWGLHVLTRDLPLGFFVMYSSAASILGSPGQANHAAANAFLDALAVHRRARGLPALSIGWGAWRDIGSAARRAVDATVSRRGLDSIDPRAGLDWLECLGGGAPAHVGLIPARWDDVVAAGVRPGQRTRLAPLLRASDRSAVAASEPVGPDASEADAWRESLVGAPAARRTELVTTLVADAVARVLAAPDAAAIDPRQPLQELGLDSLLAVELRNRLGAATGLGRAIPSTLVFDRPTIVELASYFEGVLPGGAPTAADAADAPAQPGSGDAVDSVEALTDEEVEAMLARRMQGT